MQSYAQYDPNCYFPKVGEPGVIDTIYGSENEQRLSSYMNIGPAPDSSYGSVLIGGSVANNPPFITALQGGQRISLRSLTPRHRVNLDYQELPAYLMKGHFRSPRYTDLLTRAGSNSVPRIYWSDDEGNYDSTRYTDLRLDFLGTDYWGMYQYDQMDFYIAPLTQDSVDDIVAGVSSLTTSDSDYLVHFRCGPAIYGDSVIHEDSVLLLGPYHSKTTPWRYRTQGDWRGIGRTDLIGGDHAGNLFYYRNDPPFSLAGFVHAMMYDTLLAGWQNPFPVNPNTGWIENSESMQVFNKRSKSGPMDLLMGIGREGVVQVDKYYGAFFFKGGLNFGAHRITADSADFVFHPADYYNSSFPPSGYIAGRANCGDMTGTSNNVLYVQGVVLPGSAAVNLFYVMGEALDDKIDMEFDYTSNSNVVNYGMGATGTDTITADGDNLQDVIIGLGNYVSDDDLAKGYSNVGSIQIVHGSKKIPVHTNGVARSTPTQPTLDVYPNPLRSSGTVSYSSPQSGEAMVTLYDILGRAVFAWSEHVVPGNHFIHLDFGEQPSGSYRLEVNLNGELTGKQVVVVR